MNPILGTSATLPATLRHRGRKLFGPLLIAPVTSYAARVVRGVAQTMYSAIFQFEQDFAGTLRCIPLAVRFKLDRCGVKLSLRQWSRFAVAERDRMLRLPCDKHDEVEAYRRELEELIQLRSTQPPEYMPIELRPPWDNESNVPEQVIQYAVQLQISPPSSTQWAALSSLQRFVLLKLSRAKHDNVNFVPAMREFGLLD